MPERVYHYTSLDALVGILKKEGANDLSGNEKTLTSLTFGGSRYDCMNYPHGGVVNKSSFYLKNI